MSAADVRKELIDALRLDLVGPDRELGTPDEVLSQAPARDTTSATPIVRHFADRFRATQWPSDRPLPDAYYDPQSPELSPHEKSAMHAKCIVVDERDVFISSANFTEAAQNRNLEVGILVRSSALGQNLARYFDALME